LLTNQEEDGDRDFSLDCLPDYLGELEYMTFSDLEDTFDNEAGSCKLQGTIFRDYDLNWCRINGWGMESGVPIVFYSPVYLRDEEEYASLAENSSTYVAVGVDSSSSENRTILGLTTTTIYDQELML
jgi:hypothetical protein